MAGDMGFGCHLSERKIYLCEGINVVTVVFTNHGPGNVTAFQNVRHGGRHFRHFGVDYVPMDFGAIACSFGA